MIYLVQIQVDSCWLTKGHQLCIVVEHLQTSILWEKCPGQLTGYNDKQVGQQHDMTILIVSMSVTGDKNLYEMLEHSCISKG